MLNAANHDALIEAGFEQISETLYRVSRPVPDGVNLYELVLSPDENKYEVFATWTEKDPHGQPKVVRYTQGTGKIQRNDGTSRVAAGAIDLALG